MPNIRLPQNPQPTATHNQQDPMSKALAAKSDRLSHPFPLQLNMIISLSLKSWPYGDNSTSNLPQDPA